MHKSQLNIVQSVNKTLLLLVFIFGLTQCTSRYSQKDSDKILSAERVSAKTSPISFLIPHGWRVINANDSTFSDLWMISDDNNSSLSLIPLHSSNSIRNLSKWISVSKLSYKMKFKSENIEIVDDDNAEIKGIGTASYYFKNKKALYRISLFQFKGKFYELTSLDKNIIRGESTQLSFLEQVQTAIITSIK